MVRAPARLLSIARFAAALLALAAGCTPGGQTPAGGAGAPPVRAGEALSVTLVTDLPEDERAGLVESLRAGEPPLDVHLVVGDAPAADADVFWSSGPGPGVAMARAGQTLPHVPAQPPTLRDAAGLWNGAAGVGWVLLVNRTKVPAGQAPNSIEDMSSGRFRGFISSVPPAHPLLRDYRAALTEVWGAEPARILVDLIGRNEARTFPTLATCALMVAEGHVMMTIADTRTASRFIAEVPALDTVVPDQDNMGVLLVPSVVVIPKTAPHVEAARLLVDRIVKQPVSGRLVPAEPLKVMAADVTRFTLPAVEKPADLEAPPPEPPPESAAPVSEAPASAAPTHVKRGAKKRH